MKVGTYNVNGVNGRLPRLQPGPKFDYKLAWFERFNAHARTFAGVAELS